MKIKRIIKAAAVTLICVTISGAFASCSDRKGADSSSESSQPEKKLTYERPEPSVKIETQPISLDFSKKGAPSVEANEKGEHEDFTEYGGWMSTDFVDISAYVALRYELAARYNMYSIAFYDKDKRFIDGIATESVCDLTTVCGHTEVPDGAAYARFCGFVGSNGYKIPVDTAFVEGFPDSETYAEYKDSLPYGELKILCIGDSLTEGDYGTPTSGTADKRYKNYPYFLSKLFDCETVNQGRCGINCVDYDKLYGSAINAKDADVVLIMLGTNGGMTLNGNETQKTGYMGLIMQVQADMKEGAKLVLITPPHATETEGKVNYGYNPNAENAAETVRELAERFDTYLIDAYKDGPIQADKEDIYQPVDGLHLSEEGYKALASFIAAQLDEILKK